MQQEQQALVVADVHREDRQTERGAGEPDLASVCNTDAERQPWRQRGAVVVPPPPAEQAADPGRYGLPELLIQFVTSNGRVTPPPPAGNPRPHFRIAGHRNVFGIDATELTAAHSPCTALATAQQPRHVLLAAATARLEAFAGACHAAEQSPDRAAGRSAACGPGYPPASASSSPPARPARCGAAAQRDDRRGSRAGGEPVPGAGAALAHPRRRSWRAV